MINPDDIRIVRRELTTGEVSFRVQVYVYGIDRLRSYWNLDKEFDTEAEARRHVDIRTGKLIKCEHVLP